MPDTNKVDSENNVEKPKQISYEDWGFTKAKNLNGSHSGLLSCLSLIKEDHRQMIHRDKNIQIRLKEPLIAEMNSKKEQCKDLEDKITAIEAKVMPQKENQIHILKKEINEIRKDTSSILPDKLNKLDFWIGFFILSLITIYLFIFYTSVSYSAFFKEFKQNDLGLVNSIFDAQAMSKAMNDGVTELILIITLPFVFIGLGYLIHQFQKLKGDGKYIKIIATLLITLAFDMILAYDITKKIYEIYAKDSFKNLPAEYDIWMAFASINFWLIFFAGFVVYIIWGFVFESTLKKYDKLDVIIQHIKARKREISTLVEELKEKKSKIGYLFDEIIELKKNIKSLEGRINSVIIDTIEFNKILHEFLVGWLHWMNANKLNLDFIDRARAIADQFIHNNTGEYNSNEKYLSDKSNLILEN